MDAGVEDRKKNNERLRNALLEGRPTRSAMAEEELDEESVEVFRRKWICASPMFKLVIGRLRS